MKNNALTSTDFHFEGQRSVYHGEGRDVYDINDDLLVMVATDRISAFDVVLPKGIPFKGQVLNQIAAKFLDATADICPNWKLSTPDPMVTVGLKCEGFRVEMIIRGYLTGSAWREYKNGCRELCGIRLPEGLVEASQIPEPIFTPSTKAELGLHDENISYQRMVQIVGPEVGERLRDASLAIYTAAAEYAREQGIIIADTKFEFGLIDGELTLIDECLTPASSRFWPADEYKPGRVQPSYDKQYLRNWLTANWNMAGDPPHLPAEVIEGTSARYQQAFQIITGEKFVPKKEL